MPSLFFLFHYYFYYYYSDISVQNSLLKIGAKNWVLFLILQTLSHSADYHAEQILSGFFYVFLSSQTAKVNHRDDDEHVCQISVVETSASVPNTCYADSDSGGVEDVNRR